MIAELYLFGNESPWIQEPDFCADKISEVSGYLRRFKTPATVNRESTDPTQCYFLAVARKLNDLCFIYRQQRPKQAHLRKATLYKNIVDK